MHGGQVRLESREGEGSRFTVEIPGLRAEEADDDAGPAEPATAGAASGAEGGAPAEASPPGAPDLIFVIEDNPANFKLVRDLLESRGYRVAHSSSGEEGLAALKFLRPRLILIHIHVPGLDRLAGGGPLRD